MLEPTPDHRARQVAQVPSHEVIYSAYRRDGHVLGIDRGVRWKETNAQEMSRKLTRFQTEAEEWNLRSRATRRPATSGSPSRTS